MKGMKKVVYKDINKNMELPFVCPEIKTYPYFTAILGILEAYGKHEIWIFNNYILIWMLKETHNIDYWVDFKYGDEDVQEEFCSLINKKVVSREFIAEEFCSIIDAIIFYIIQNNYVMVSVDVFDIDEWWLDLKNRKHLRHQLCIHGYDIDNRTLTISDFINGSLYNTIKIGFQEFEKGYINYKNYQPYEEFGKDIWLLSLNPDADEKIDLVRICNLIKDYLNSNDTYIINHIQTENKMDRYIYGMEMLIELKKYVQDVYSDEYKSIDVRVFHILRVMHEVMYRRFKYIENNIAITDKTAMKKVLELIGEAYDNTRVLESLCLKYQINKKKSKLQSIEIKLDTFIYVEKNMLEECFALLKKCLN